MVRESLGIVAVVAVPGKAQRPVGKLIAKRIPAFVVPAAAKLLALDQDVLAAALAQVMAHREPGLTAADDDAVVPLHRADDQKAERPVIARPMISAWTSCVPS